MKRPKAETRLQGVARIRAETRGAPDPFADRIEAQAREKLPADLVVYGAGGELVPDSGFSSATDIAILDTLSRPDAVAADASRDRLDLLEQAGSLTLGLDTADAVQAGDSLERMLAHQLATVHLSTMKMSVQLNRQIERLDVANPRERQNASVEASRLAGAVARLSGTFQAGMTTLQRVRSGGRQTVIVQHTHINEGGQAVVAGQVEGPGVSGGRRGRHQ